MSRSTKFDSLPQLDLLSKLNSSRNSSDSDPDLNLPQQVNFGYYSTLDFKDSDEISNCTSSNHFSILHTNIRSLSANFDTLSQMLTDMTTLFL